MLRKLTILQRVKSYSSANVFHFFSYSILLKCEDDMIFSYNFEFWLFWKLASFKMIFLLYKASKH